MSVTTSGAAVPNGLPQPTRSRRQSLKRVRIVVLITIGADLAVMIVGAAASPGSLLDVWPEVLLWSAAAAVVGTGAIETPSGQQLGLDMPVLLAAGYVLGPLPAGVIAVAGYIDMREFRREIPLERALFNRAQTSLSVIIASAMFAVVVRDSSSVPVAIFGALLAVSADSLVNYASVAGIMALADGVPARDSLRRLRLGSILSFMSTYVSFGLISLLLAETYSAVGSWALFLFAMPVFLARQAFTQGQRLDGAMSRISIQDRALKEMDGRLLTERRDERLAIASGLHDEVLPPLFRVHMLGQVLRQELASGRLLAMEDDLPQLLAATEEASEMLRGLIRNLKNTTFAGGGLARTIHLLVRDLESTTSMKIHVDLEEATGTPMVELLAYQVAREALRNAIRHSNGSEVVVLLRNDVESIRLQVQDDGQGFNPRRVDQESHFGIALMRERVELAGGVMQIDTSPGNGTRVIARLPAVIAAHHK